MLLLVGCRHALGQELFFEPALSSTGTVACVTCHDPTRWFIDTRSANNVSFGAVGWTRRNSMGLVDIALKDVVAPATAHDVSEPAEIEVTPERPNTATGVFELLTVPSPSIPKKLLPQHVADPVVRRAQVIVAPASTSATPDSPVTATGTFEGFVDPSPS